MSGAAIARLVDIISASWMCQAAYAAAELRIPDLLDGASRSVDDLARTTRCDRASLFRLLLGFERPESGAVFYDGKSIETLDASALRRQLGVVLQSARLANGNIYENICGGLRLPLDQVFSTLPVALLSISRNS